MHHHLRRAVLVGMVGIGLTSVVLPVHAQQSAVVARTRQTTATIETVDARTRQVLLRLQDGTYATMVAGPEVRNFAQLKPGDRVNARYEGALVARIGRPDQVLLADQDLGYTATAPKGQKPYGERGLEVRRRIQVTATDPDNNTLSFMGADNVPRTVQVRTPEMQAFLRTLKPGDIVDVTYREAVVVAVEPAG